MYWTHNAGSVIKYVLCIIFAEGSIDKILSGHSYARAHIILQQALSMLIFDDKKENEEFRQLLENEETMTYMLNVEEISSNPEFQKLHKLFEKITGGN